MGTDGVLEVPITLRGCDMRKQHRSLPGSSLEFGKSEKTVSRKLPIMDQSLKRLGTLIPSAKPLSWDRSLAPKLLTTVRRSGLLHRETHTPDSDERGCLLQKQGLMYAPPPRSLRNQKRGQWDLEDPGRAPR